MLPRLASPCLALHAVLQLFISDYAYYTTVNICVSVIIYDVESLTSTVQGLAFMSEAISMRMIPVSVNKNTACMGSLGHAIQQQKWLSNPPSGALKALNSQGSSQEKVFVKDTRMSRLRLCLRVSLCVDVIVNR